MEIGFTLKLLWEICVKKLCILILVSGVNFKKPQKSGVNILINMDQFYLSETIRFVCFFLIQIKESFECDTSFSTEVEL